MSDGGAGARGRPRSSRTDAAIQEAALELLRRDGPGAVNVDAVAARSGVARTTIYRRYRSRTELLRAVLRELVEPALPPPTLPVPEKLHWVLERGRALLEEGIGRGGTAALLADRDPEFTGVLRALLADRLTELAAAMRSDVAAGRVHPRVDPDALAGVLFGAYLAEVLRYGEPRPDWAERTAGLLEPAVVAGRPAGKDDVPAPREER